MTNDFDLSLPPSHISQLANIIICDPIKIYMKNICNGKKKGSGEKSRADSCLLSVALRVVFLQCRKKRVLGFFAMLIRSPVPHQQLNVEQFVALVTFLRSL